MLRTAALAIVIAFSGAMAANAQPAAPPARSECFLSGKWQSWKPGADSRSIYIRVNPKRVFRIDLSSACPMLQRPGVILLTRTHGSPWICHPLDLDLTVSDRQGARTPCLVSGITRLTPEQVAALPKDVRP